ncbi:MAG: efflux RND transporter periplasmic adaptor subunit, partial [Holophagales bacterium]|nr:efflux RND transporter periplasmic adaptor subunit [Holophagales bacterium]
WLPADLGWRWGEGAPAAETGGGETQLWTCGMHPQVLEDSPGQCPICGMDLTPMRADGDQGSAGAGHAHFDPGEPAPSWTCPDHASITRPEAGTCPIDGLELVPAEPEAPSGDAPPAPPSYSGTVVRIDPTVVQNMNVRIASAERRDLVRPIRTVGYLEYDQQRMVTVTTKYSGWIEKVYVNYVGEKVRRDQPLFEIYSPELVQTERELLSALRFAEEMRDAPEDARRRALSLVESARARLGYWDISPEQIARLETTGAVFRTLEVRSPAGGMVMKRMAGLEGMAVRPGMELFHLADLSSLWLSVELFEDQMAWVGEGTEARVDFSYFPGESFRGTVRFLEPALSEATRTLRAKIEVANPEGRLRKGMYATVELEPVAVPNALAVPAEAVLRTGERNLVVLDLGGGRFVPREVELGLEAAGFAQVLGGLDDGERIVTSSQFLLDSESSLRESIRKMIAEHVGH